MSERELTLRWVAFKAGFVAGYVAGRNATEDAGYEELTAEAEARANRYQDAYKPVSPKVPMTDRYDDPEDAEAMAQYRDYRAGRPVDPATCPVCGCTDTVAYQLAVPGCDARPGRECLVCDHWGFL
jgi:hypothetical protein